MYSPSEWRMRTTGETKIMLQKNYAKTEATVITVGAMVWCFDLDRIPGLGERPGGPGGGPPARGVADVLNGDDLPAVLAPVPIAHGGRTAGVPAIRRGARKLS